MQYPSEDVAFISTARYQARNSYSSFSWWPLYYYLHLTDGLLRLGVAK